jgi:hypothetical protein
MFASTKNFILPTIYAIKIPDFEKINVQFLETIDLKQN